MTESAIRASDTRQTLAFYSFCGLTTLAVAERVSQVVADSLGVLPWQLTWLLMAIYGVYLLGLHVLMKRWDLWLLRRSSGQVHLLFLAGWLLIGLLFSVLYPLADSGSLGFYSDRDEALDIAVKQLGRGHFPYGCRVQSGIHDGCPEQGNPVGPMPGGLLFAAPVVWLLGQAAPLSWLTLGFTYLALWSHARQPAWALGFLTRLLLSAPIVLAETLSGGDLLANAVAVSLPLILLLRQPEAPRSWMWSLLLGIALSWRGLFWLLAVPVSLYWWRRGLWTPWLRHGLWLVAGFVTVTLPLVYWNPAGFTPWQVQQRLDSYQHILPHAAIVLPVFALALGAVWAWRAPDLQSLLWGCALTLLVPTLGAAILHAVQVQQLTWTFYGWYALATVLLLTLHLRQLNPPAGRSP